MNAPEQIYKIATAESYAAAAATGRYDGMPVDLTDGYIHFSTAAQAPETLARHFAGQEDLVLIAVRTSDVADKLRWEPSRGGALFPHLYGRLPLSAVAWTAPIAVAEDGSCNLPEAVK
jgi:uncharacterized protein (DUF952 family)